MALLAQYYKRVGVDCNKIRREEPALVVRSGKFARLTPSERHSRAGNVFRAGRDCRNTRNYNTHVTIKIKWENELFLCEMR